MNSPRSPRLAGARPLAGLALAAVLVAACGGGSALPTPNLTPAPTADPAATPGPAATRVEVTLTDGFQILLSSPRVAVGVPVTFVITNQGGITHDFFLGDEAAQAEHEMEMAGGGMHDSEMGVSVPGGATKELTVTFPSAGTTIAGCHVPGHYPAGMKATITLG